LALTLASCGPSQETPTVPHDPSVETGPSAPAKTVDPASAGVLKGKVLYDGVVPEPRMLSVKGNPECAALHPGGTIASEELVSQSGFLQNVFVYVKQGLEGYAFEPPAGPVTISNKRCVYVPHVSGARVGQDVVFLNEDSTLHNIHSYPKNAKPFNLGLPLVGMKQVKRFDAAEVMVPLKCDVHPWMLGYLGVLTHPYFQVTGADGTFELKDLPAGEYVIEAWHEKLGAQTQTVTLGPQETREMEFRFGA
jgi:hypothetical protein